MVENRFGANCLAAYFVGDQSSAGAHLIALDAITSAGCTTTEIFPPGLLPLREAPRIRDHARQLGVEIRAVHAPPMRRDPNLARQQLAARLAAELGATILVVHVSSLRFASPDPAVRADARDRDLLRLEALAAFCHPMGITLGLENGKHPDHPSYLFALLEALEGTPRRSYLQAPPLGLVFDSGHAVLGGDPLAVARAMLPRLVHTHLHDNHGRRDEHLPPGDGRIDWSSLLTCLTAGGYTGPLLLELRPRRGQTAADWQQEMARGRKVLSDAGS